MKSSSQTTPRRQDWLESVWMEVQDEIDYEAKNPQQSWPCLYPDCAKDQVPGGPCYGRTEQCK